jgi:hypothetical protein
MTPGGDTSPMTVPEVAAKVSATKSGTPLSDETKEKLSIARKAFWASKKLKQEN